MFSALRRLTGKGEVPESATGSTQPGHQTMSANLQRKFARGVQYNMKIIIKGDRNVGKTCLYYRLQGKKFVESYTPTEEIQVASIHWNYKATDDIVKVDVWDVVDKGKKKKTFDGLKFDNSQIEVPEEAALDAEFLDVYKNANGVILVMDITKSWTFNYIQRELPKIPEHIPIIILANHCDMAHHRTVTPHHLSFYVENLQRRPEAAQVRCCESSMRNGFGLKMLYKFFNLPFLQLQKDTLLKQLETNKNETELTINELDLYMESDDADYNKFLENLTKKRRVIADSAKPAHLQNSQSNHQLQQMNKPQSYESEVKRSISFNETYKIGPIGGGHPISSGHQKTAIGVGNPHSKALGPQAIMSDFVSRTSGDSKKEPSIQYTNNRTHAPEPAPKESGGFISKFFGKTKDVTPEKNVENKSANSKTDVITTVDEFVPDDGTIDRTFLEETGQEMITSNVEPESDSDDEFGNPLVSGFQDDLDPDDIATSRNSWTDDSLHLNNNNKNNNSDNNNFSKTISFENNNSKISRLSEDSVSDVSVNFNALTVNGNDSRNEKSQSATVFANSSGCQTADFKKFDITGEALNTWFSCDSKWRQSPEGGEDNSSGQKLKSDTESLDSLNFNSTLLDTTSAKTEEKKKKKKEDERKTKKAKKKSSVKTKETKGQDKTKSDKKKISRVEENESRERDELEEFLNGPSAAFADASYEAF